jgi:hypothetical protein
VFLVESVYRMGFGRFAEAEPAARQAVERARAADDPQMYELALTTLGHVEFYTGRAAAAEASYAEVLRSAEARKNIQHAAWGLFSRARSLIALDQLDDAVPLLDDARRLLAQKPELDSEIICLGLYAAAQLRRDEPLVARRFADETLARIRRARPTGFSTRDGYDGAAEVYLGLWQARQRRGLAASDERARAGEVASALTGLARLFPMAGPAAELRRGQLERLSGRTARARRRFEASQRAALRLGMPRDRELAEHALENL